MAIGDPYATLADIKDYLGGSQAFPDTSQDAKLTSALASASSEIERFCDRQFNQSTTLQTRHYIPTTWDECDFDDVYSLTGFQVITDPGGVGNWDTTLTADQYELDPPDGLMYGNPWPYYHMRSIGGIWFPKVLYRRRATVQITAYFGWASVPAPVHQACLIMAAQEYKLKDAPFGTSGMSEYGSGTKVAEIPYIKRQLTRFAKHPYLMGA